MRFHIFVFIGFLLSGTASAQNIPTPLLEISKYGDTVIPKGKLSKEQNAYLWKDTKKTADGYLQIQSRPEAIDILLQAKTYAKQSPPDEFRLVVSELSSHGFSLIGNIKESPNRNSLVFADSHGLLMVTIWDYRKDGAAITEAEDFLNATVRSSPAVLSLLSNETQPKLLWKVTWLKNGRQYELYVEDVKTRRGLPSRAFQEILALASTVMPSQD